MDFGRPQSKQSSRTRPILYAVGGVALIALLWMAFKPSPAVPLILKAVAVLKGDSSASGTVTFTQSKPWEPVTVIVDLEGLDPSAKRGFHIQYVHLCPPMSLSCDVLKYPSSALLGT